jgi:O-antigen ligase
VDPDATRRALALATAVVALGLAAAPALRSRRPALAAAATVCGGALAVAVYGVVARTLFGNLLYGTIPVPTIAPFGPFVSKNHFAGYVEMAALLAAGLALGLADEARRSAAALSWVESTRAPRIVLAGGVSVAMALAVLISLSRGGAVSLAAGAAVVVALRRFVRLGAAPSRRGWAVGALVATVALGAIAVLPGEARARLATIVGMTHDNSGRFRVSVWGDALRLWTRSPVVGHGYGAFGDALPPFKTGLGYVSVEHAESDLLETLVEGGLVGLGLAIAAGLSFALPVLSGLRRQKDRLRRGLGVGACAGLAALLVHSAFDFNLRIPSNALLFAFLAALALAAAEAQESASRRLARVAPLALALALALAALTPAAPTRALPDEAAAFLVKGGRPVTPLRVEQATRSVIDAVRRRPANAEAWLFLAWLRSATGDQSAAAELARHAAALDPERKALVDAARHLVR